MLNLDVAFIFKIAQTANKSALSTVRLLIARKHISWTCKDFKGASNLRNNLVRAVDKNEVKNLIIKMIKTLNNEKNRLA